jgi:hypothetical protein
MSCRKTINFTEKELLKFLENLLLYNLFFFFLSACRKFFVRNVGSLFHALFLTKELSSV